MKALLHRLFLGACFAAMLPYEAVAGNGYISRYVLSDPIAAQDSVPSNKPAAKPESKPSDKPEIKEVPKSRRQLKPSVVDDKIRIKPPIRVKPVIKDAGGYIKRTLGKIKL